MTSARPNRLDIHDLVCAGRISPRDGAILLELRRYIAWKSRPWWDRALSLLVEAAFR